MIDRGDKRERERGEKEGESLIGRGRNLSTLEWFSIVTEFRGVNIVS